MAQGAKWPPEIWTSILLELGSPHRNALHPFLTVSSSFRNLTLPLIYDSILVSPPQHVENSGHMVMINHHQTGTYGLRLQSLLLTLETNTNLARFVTTFALASYDCGHHVMVALRRILSRLSNLKRLHLSVVYTEDLAEMIKSLPSSIALTHLSIPASSTCPAIIPFLESQRTSLRFLAFPVGFLRSPIPVSFEALNTIKGASDNHIWGEVVKSAPIRHLDTGILPISLIQSLESVFSNLVSIKMDSLDVLHVIGPHLDSLRFISITEPSEDVVDHTPDLMRISSKSITYIQYCRLGFVAESERFLVESLFKRYPSLLAIDVDAAVCTYFGDLGSHGTYRYYQHAECPIQVSVCSPYFFEAWWEPIRDSLELA
ncbi:hypothetical protein ONZ45_g3061 [Pleurotus djamor]|nr:hypothetical protein ONZ45_g3061 [Pleurotus djamor]